MGSIFDFFTGKKDSSLADLATTAGTVYSSFTGPGTTSTPPASTPPVATPTTTPSVNSKTMLWVIGGIGAALLVVVLLVANRK